jgi:predicted O-methyltransferase YrrM
MTTAADFMLSNMHTGGWGNPHWNGDEANGSVMPGEGQLLYGLVRALRPAAVLEIGTAYGFSSIHIAAALRDNGGGVLHTVEIADDRRAQAMNNVARAGLAAWVEFHCEPPTGVQFGFAFLDGEHTAEALRAYLGMVAPQLEPGAPVVVHDALWQGHLQVAFDAGWGGVVLPHTSYAGLAILQKME